jgi:hypothetical protein
MAFHLCQIAAKKFARANSTANGWLHGGGQDARSKIPDPGEICGLSPNGTYLTKLGGF